MADGDLRRARVGPMHALPPPRKGDKFDHVPHEVANALTAAGKSYLERTWRQVQRALVFDQIRHHQIAQHGGLQPCEFVVKLAADLRRHRKTIERHLRELDELGALNRYAVEGRPRRGPGTRVLYFLRHSAVLKPLAAIREAYRARNAPKPPEAAPAPVDAARGPPERTPEERAASAAAARAETEALKAKYQHH